MFVKYTKENPLRVFEAFAGYGSQSMALERIKEIEPTFDYKVVGYSDIDKMQSAGISESQQYKLAGNSIVVDCLVNGIFKKPFH